MLSASGKVVISMVTRQYRRPYLRSPYIREQLEHPKQQLLHAVEMLEEFRHRVGEALFDLQQLTEEEPGRGNSPDDGASDGKVNEDKGSDKDAAVS